MNRLNTKIWGFLLSGIFLGLTACEEEKKKDELEPVPPLEEEYTLKAALEDQPQFSTFNKLVEKLDEDERGLFSNRVTNYTVFAPTNTAFQVYFDSTSNNSVDDIPNFILSRWAQYFTLPERLALSDIKDGPYKTLRDYGVSSVNEFSHFSTILIDKKGAAELWLNGNNANGAATVADSIIRTINGNIIAVDGIIRPQNLIENLRDGEKILGATPLLQRIAKATKTTREDILTEAKHFVLMPDKAQLRKVFDFYLSHIFDTTDLQNLLGSSARSQLYARYNVNSLSGLLQNIQLSDLTGIAGQSVSAVYTEMDATDNDRLLNKLILFQGFALLEELQGDTPRQVTNLDFTRLKVSKSNNGNPVLTDPAGISFTLGQKLAVGQGTIYEIKSVQ